MAPRTSNKASDGCLDLAQEDRKTEVDKKKGWVNFNIPYTNSKRGETSEYLRAYKGKKGLVWGLDGHQAIRTRVSFFFLGGGGGRWGIFIFISSV